MNRKKSKIYDVKDSHCYKNMLKMHVTIFSNLLASHLCQDLYMVNHPSFHLNHSPYVVYVSFFFEEHFLKRKWPSEKSTALLIYSLIANVLYTAIIPVILQSHIQAME